MRGITLVRHAAASARLPASTALPHRPGPRSRRRSGSRPVALLCLVILLLNARSGPVFGQDTGASRDEPEYWLRLNVPAFEATLLDGSTYVKTYPVAVGRSWSQTPLGSFTIVYKAVHPWWIPPGGGRVVPPGPSNPLGSRWMGLSKPGYGLHSTNAPGSIGHAVSLGCVRMMPQDAEEVFDLVRVGSRVEIVYEFVSLSDSPEGCSIRVHKDIYQKGVPTREEVACFLSGRGLDAAAIDAVMPQVLRELARPTGFAIKAPAAAGPGLGEAPAPGGTGVPGLIPSADARPPVSVIINGTPLSAGAVRFAPDPSMPAGSLESQDEFASSLWLDADEACKIAGLDLTTHEGNVYLSGLTVSLRQDGEHQLITLLRFVVASGGFYRREGSVVQVFVWR